MSNQLYNQYSRRKIYIVRHIITVRFPFTHSLISPDDFCRPTNLLHFFVGALLYAIWPIALRRFQLTPRSGGIKYMFVFCTV